jgi:hypothetical protein
MENFRDNSYEPLIFRNKEISCSGEWLPTSQERMRHLSEYRAISSLLGAMRPENVYYAVRPLKQNARPVEAFLTLKGRQVPSVNHGKCLGVIFDKKNYMEITCKEWPPTPYECLLEFTPF